MLGLVRKCASSLQGHSKRHNDLNDYKKKLYPHMPHSGGARQGSGSGAPQLFSFVKITERFSAEEEGTDAFQGLSGLNYVNNRIRTSAQKPSVFCVGLQIQVILSTQTRFIQVRRSEDMFSLE